ncbi:MFS general substrate transporter [Pluteus cervinus]|uniref:MFS general substrate transporter n=1 Tax=Pluteus cervinus TaxID=181527 RepID=A0ACD3APP6_9AGAR|nr:MFS general substrate transporter [Pluteus cervinus]
MTHLSPQLPAEDASLGSETLTDGLVTRSLESVQDTVDPRLTPDSRPDNTLVDETLGHQLRSIITRHSGHYGAPTLNKLESQADEEPIYVEFKEGDERDPINFPRRKKWLITFIVCSSTIMASMTAAAYNLGFPSMMRDLHCTQFQATIGLSVFPLGFAIVPLVTASLSEELGRRPLYIYSGIGYLLMYMTIALAKNIETVILARFLQGAFGSTGATMVGGTIADIWTSRERGLPMSIFAFAAVGGTGLGPLFSGWVEMNPHLEWRWIQWIQMIMFAVYLCSVPIFVDETRSAVLLTKMARQLRKDTGDHRYRARIEDERDSLKTLIFISCTRPVRLMLTEPVVISFSLWIGFAWGVLFCLLESISDTFRRLHNFNTGQVGSVFITMTIGSVLGSLTNISQERLYQKYASSRGPEARLYWACGASVLFPIGMFIYAWSAFPSIPWFAQAIGIVIFMWAAFIMYLAVFSYLADCYGPFASSALAGQSLLRNVLASIFPLFTTQMFQKLHYQWASTLLALIACLMIPIPFILFFYGHHIRKLSTFSRAVIEMQEKAANNNATDEKQ